PPPPSVHTPSLHDALPICLQKSLQNFLPFETLAPAVLLDDHVGNFVDALVGCEAAAAFQALAAAANGVADAAFPRINHLVVDEIDRKSTRLNSSHQIISYA